MNAHSRRALFVLVAVITVIVTTALPAIADEELDRLLEQIEGAQFSGSQVIITTWDGVTEVSVVHIDHNSGVTVVEGGDGVATLGRGRAVRSGGGNGAAVSVWNDVSSDRYEIIMGDVRVRQGREVRGVEIREGTLLRARMTIDVESGAPIVTEVFDADGRRFRYSAMFEFTPWSLGTTPATEPVFDVSMHAESYPIDEVAGYSRADTYASPDDSLHSFFSDGLFSFSLFQFDGVATIDHATLEPFSSGGREYRRRITATEVYVSWQSGGETYVLVGDLPPDHLAEVLQELPRPRGRSFFSRLWSGIFG